jgi:hypothetical protein
MKKPFRGVFVRLTPPSFRGSAPPHFLLGFSRPPAGRNAESARLQAEECLRDLIDRLTSRFRPRLVLSRKTRSAPPEAESTWIESHPLSLDLGPAATRFWTQVEFRHGE